jgi:glycosyltransferase involved in cell wall biosynthesis
LFSTASGIGESARSCFKALAGQSERVLSYDLSQAFNQTDLAPWPSSERGDFAKCSTLIIHLNAPEFEKALLELGLGFWRKKRIIGYWAWELPEFPDGWEQATRLVSEIWVPSAYVKDVLQKKVDKKIRVVPHYIEPVETCEPTYSTNPHILVMADGSSSFERKNVLGAISIFQLAFRDRDQVRLTVKLRNLEHHPETCSVIHRICGDDNRISLVSETLSTDALKNLMRSCDILLSAHRAEGFGLHLAEAMAMAKVVVATNWSGNCDFMTEHNSILLPYNMVPISDTSGIYKAGDTTRWAEPDIAESAFLLQDISKDLARQRALSLRARHDVSETLSHLNTLTALTE